MIEIVFSGSACGSLKLAQHYGGGKYSSGCVGVFVHHDDGSEPTEEEVRAAQQEAEERERVAWERAVPLGGSPGDVYEFGFGWSIGSIAEDQIGSERRQVLDQKYRLFSNDAGEELARERLEGGEDQLKAVFDRALAGEAIRVWYSSQPEEMCGLYWFMARLCPLAERCGPVYAVRLPEWEERADGTLERKSGWGDVAPGEWHRYVALQKKVPLVFCRSRAAHWRELQKENAPLRAVLNGQLASVPEDIYDSFLRREIQEEPGEFWEAKIIGQVLGKYQLGIGDVWLALRIEEMIRRGELEAVTEPEEGDAVYRRMVRKTEKWNKE